MKVGVPKEVRNNERRVALVPDSVSKLTTAGVEVIVQAGAGETAYFFDDAYVAAGATIAPKVQSLFESADVIVKVQRPIFDDKQAQSEIAMMPSGSVLIALLQPLFNPDLVRELAECDIIGFSMDSIPRIARAQSMDALSSMANIAGYRAVVEAAQNFGRFFTGQITAAGKVPPAKVMVIGAGVAGLASKGSRPYASGT